MPNAALATQVRAAKGGKRLKFAFIHKGAEGKLLIAKKVSAKEVAEAKKEAGGGTIYQGKCVGEDGVLWFETAKAVPGTLANQVKRAIREDAGISTEVQFREKADADAEETETEEVPPAPPSPDAAGSPPTAPKAKPAEQVALENRMKATIKSLAGQQTGTSEKAQQIQRLLREAQALMTAGNFAEANRKLDSMAPLLTRSPDQVRYEDLLGASRANIEAALPKRGGKQIKTHYDQATTAGSRSEWAKAIALLEKTNQLVAVAAVRNPYVELLDRAKPIIEPMLLVKFKGDDPNVLLLNAARDKLNTLWVQQDGHAKKDHKEYPQAIAKLQAALVCVKDELKPLIDVKAQAAKEKLATAELAVDAAKSALASAPAEGRAAKLEEIRGLVENLFAAGDDAKDLGVTSSGATAASGAPPDRTINCEQMYRTLDWFELKRRLNLPEKPGVLPANRENLTPGEMKQLWNWRSAEVNKLIDSLRSKYPTLIAKACGSNDLESDIDITFATPGADNYGDDIKAAKEFNDAVIKRFGKPAGRTFDVNIYCRDYRAIKESRNQEYNAAPIGDKDVDQPVEQKSGGMDFRSASAEDQDVAALMKQRRFMSGKQWQDYRDGILADTEAGLRKKNPGANPKQDKAYLQVAKQLDEAEDVYLLSLRKMLVGIQKTVAKRYPDRVRDDPNYQKLEELLRDPNAKNVEAEMQKLHKILTSGEYGSVAMEATDEMYLDMMAEVRENQQKIETMPESPAKEALKVQVKKDLFTNIFFANEAYASEGAITHIVAGSQAGLSTEELAKKLKPTETVQSANEQLADFLKDMEHYGEEEHEAAEKGGNAADVAGQAFVHGSKYLERLLDATAILAAQFAPKTPTDPPAPELQWFGKYVKDASVTGKETLKQKAEALQQRIRALLLNLRKSSKVPAELKRPLAVDEVKKIFDVSNIQKFTAVMMELGRELNTVVRQREQFQASVDVGADVTKERMKNVNESEREKAMTVVRKLTRNARALPPVQALSLAFSKLDPGSGAAATRLATEICGAWNATLEAHKVKNAALMPRALGLLKTKVKAIPDIEVANEFQGVVKWLGEASEMLAMSTGPTATPENQQIVTNINQAEALSAKLYDLTYGATWEANASKEARASLTAAKKAKLLDDMDKAKVTIGPALEQLQADVIESIPEAVKQRIVDVLRDLTSRGNDLDRRRGELDKMDVV